MRVVDAIAEWFEVAGFHKYFGYAGGSIWPFMDALTPKTNTLEGIQAKHEAHAVHMADMYYRLTGKMAPVIVNKGPGLLNAVGAAASAMHDSAPVLIIAGSGTTHFMGKAGMQEIFYSGHEDALNVFRPVVKGCWLIIRPDSADRGAQHRRTRSRPPAGPARCSCSFPMTSSSRRWTARSKRRFIAARRSGVHAPTTTACGVSPT